jgi:hypothetical protein
MSGHSSEVVPRFGIKVCDIGHSAPRRRQPSHIVATRTRTVMGPRAANQPYIDPAVNVP